MALETLKDVEEIGGFPVLHIPDGDQCTEGPADFVRVNHNINSIVFFLQNGPIKEVGVNGCQVDTIIEAARLIIEGLNEKFPCEENKRAVDSLDGALEFLAIRTADREKRGVEGKNEQ